MIVDHGGGCWPVEISRCRPPAGEGPRPPPAIRFPHILLRLPVGHSPWDRLRARIRPQPPRRWTAPVFRWTTGRLQAGDAVTLRLIGPDGAVVAGDPGVRPRIFAGKLADRHGSDRGGGRHDFPAALDPGLCPASSAAHLRKLAPTGPIILATRPWRDDPAVRDRHDQERLLRKHIAIFVGATGPYRRAAARWTAL